MSDLISAAEAREITNSMISSETLLKDISEKIVKAAERSENRVTFRSGPFSSSSLYGQTEHQYRNNVRKVLEVLRGKGYSAQIVCEERQFVDIYLEIRW